jgi:hypothetical protein
MGSRRLISASDVTAWKKAAQLSAFNFPGPPPHATVPFVPEVARFHGIVITVRGRERNHREPHFHARWSGRDASVRIDPLELFAGQLPSVQLAQVMQWARLHQAELGQAWQDMRAGRRPGQIPPLP